MRQYLEALTTVLEQTQSRTIAKHGHHHSQSDGMEPRGEVSGEMKLPRGEARGDAKGEVTPLSPSRSGEVGSDGDRTPLGELRCGERGERSGDRGDSGDMAPLPPSATCACSICRPKHETTSTMADRFEGCSVKRCTMVGSGAAAVSHLKYDGTF